MRFYYQHKTARILVSQEYNRVEVWMKKASIRDLLFNSSVAVTNLEIYKKTRQKESRPSPKNQSSIIPRGSRLCYTNTKK